MDNELKEIIHELSATMKTLTYVLVKLEGHFEKEEVGEPVSLAQLQEIAADLNLVENIGSIPPVEVEDVPPPVKHAMEKPSIRDVIASENISFQEAREWFLNEFGTYSDRLLRQGFIPEDHLMKMYAEEYLRQVKAARK